MSEYMLEILHCGVILVFGIYLSASFLGIYMNRRNIMILSGFSAILGTVNISSFLLFGMEFSEKIYPLMIHLPLVILFHLVYKYQVNSSVLAVCVAYLCCQISNWGGLFFYRLQIRNGCIIAYALSSIL